MGEFSEIKVENADSLCERMRNATEDERKNKIVISCPIDIVDDVMRDRNYFGALNIYERRAIVEGAMECLRSWAECQLRNEYVPKAIEGVLRGKGQL